MSWDGFLQEEWSEISAGENHDPFPAEIPLQFTVENPNSNQVNDKALSEALTSQKSL